MTVSLDGHSGELYRQVRGVDGLPALTRGVKAFRALAPGVPFRARSTLHRHNFRHLAQLIDRALEMGIPQVSFLAADVGPDSFNRGAQPLPEIELHPRVSSCSTQVRSTSSKRSSSSVIRSHARELGDGRVTPGPAGLRRLVRYYAAHLGLGPFPPVACNAPWMSVYIGADGRCAPASSTTRWGTSGSGRSGRL